MEFYSLKEIREATLTNTYVSCFFVCTSTSVDKKNNRIKVCQQSHHVCCGKRSKIMTVKSYEWELCYSTDFYSNPKYHTKMTVGISL